MDLFKSTGHNSAENCSIVLKIRTNLDIILINLYTKFQFDMCTLYEENKRKVLGDLPTTSKAICLPFFKLGHNQRKNIMIRIFLVEWLKQNFEYQNYHVLKWRRLNQRLPWARLSIFTTFSKAFILKAKYVYTNLTPSFPLF